MGTRCGQIDPGVILYLPEQEGMSRAEVTRMLFLDSVLKGLSGLAGDMRGLLAPDSPAAAQAVEYVVVRIRGEIGAMAAARGGLDTVVVHRRHRRERGRDPRAGLRRDGLAGRVTRPCGQRSAVRRALRDGARGCRVGGVLRTDAERVIARALAGALAG